MNPRPIIARGLPSGTVLAFILTLAGSPQSLLAEDSQQPAAGKLYFANVTGDTQIRVGNQVENPVATSTYAAEGAIIETKPGGTNAMVLSNSTGIYFDPGTQIEVKNFKQEAFAPDHTDLETEPSVSHTEIELSRGTIAVSTSTLLAASSMTYSTPLGSIDIQGGNAVNMVIQSEAGFTKISMLDGEGTVHSGSLDLGGKILHKGEQAIIRPGGLGQPNIVEIIPIPDSELPGFQASTSIATEARRSVFFDVDTHDPSRIVAAPVVRNRLPVQLTASPARL